MNTLQNPVPYSQIREQLLETWDGQLIAGYKINPIDIECSDEKDLDEIGWKISYLLNSMSPSCQYKVVANQYKRSGEWRRNFTLWIQFQKSGISKSNILKTKLFLKAVSHSEQQDQIIFAGHIDRLEAGLVSSGLSFERLPENKISVQLGSCLRPSLDIATTLDEVSSFDLVINPNTLLADHLYWGAVSVVDYPDQVVTGFLSDALPAKTNCMACISLAPLETEKAIDSLKRKRKVSASLTATNGRLRDLESEAKLQSEDELLESLVLGNEKVFDCQVAVTVATESPEELTHNLEQVTNALKSKGLSIHRESIALYPVFQSTQPGRPIDRSRSTLLPTSCVQALLPIFEIDHGHPLKLIEFKNRNNEPAHIDLWDSSLTSYNAVISGTSGSGKSFLSNVLLKRLNETIHPYVFIIDIGGSYRRLTQLQGGQYITFDLSGKNGFNPLGNISLSDPSSLEAAIEILCSIIGDSSGVAKYERNLLLKDLTELMKEKSGDITLSILKNRWEKASDEFLRHASTILYGWTGDRAFGQLLDNSNKLDLTNRWLSFDLRGLNEHPDLQRVVMLAIIKRLWEIVRYSDDKKILLLDEVWALIQNNSAFIGEAFRTFRKHNASAFAVTQSLEDLATEALTSAVLNNTPTKIILKQSLKPERLQALLNLNNRELSIVRGLQSIKGQYSEFFMINGEKKRFLKLEPTAEDYWFSTTNPTDLDFIRQFMTAHPELTELQSCRQIAKIYGKEIP